MKYGKKKIIRTVLVLGIIGLLCFGTFSLSRAIVKSIEKRNLWKTTLMKVTDEETLSYAIESNIDFIISGTVTANGSKTLPELNQSFSGVKKVRYQYESRIVTETVTDEEGNTKTKTKTVWEWNRKTGEEFKIDTVTLYGRTFNLSQIPYTWVSKNYGDISNDLEGRDGIYNYDGYYTRYRYEVIPLQWNITAAYNSNLEMLYNFHGDTIEEALKPSGTGWPEVLCIIFMFLFEITGILFLIFWEKIFYNFLID